MNETFLIGILFIAKLQVGLPKEAIVDRMISEHAVGTPDEAWKILDAGPEAPIVDVIPALPPGSTESSSISNDEREGVTTSISSSSSSVASKTRNMSSDEEKVAKNPSSGDSGNLVPIRDHPIYSKYLKMMKYRMLTANN